MLKQIASHLKQTWQIPESLLNTAIQTEESLFEQERKIQEIAELNSLKVLAAFKSAGIREHHLQGSYGYGYSDAGRESLDRLFASIFCGEDALVRSQFVSGTHALRCALFGLVRPGDEVLVIPQTPYDTLHSLFGLKSASGSLLEWNVTIRSCSLDDFMSGRVAPNRETKVVFVQRSKGYSWAESISISQLELLIAKVKSYSPSIHVVVDNCYGEFAEACEPCEIGADACVGSLIKNPGGGLALTGGYIVGKSALVEGAANALTAPGLGKDVGATLGATRSMFMGVFFAPQFVGEAMKTSLFAGQFFKNLGYPVLPEPEAHRTDTIQAIQLGDPKKVLAFARGVQSAGPLEHSAIPEAVPMAGYKDSIVMTGGTFVPGGSLEFSCDAPLRPPYVVYTQGGLSSLHGKLGLLLAAKHLRET